MANILRSSKPGSDWTFNELHAYNIHIQYQNTTEFFGVDLMPAPQVDEELLMKKDVTSMSNFRNRELAIFLQLASNEEKPEEAPVDDLAVAILRLLNYDGDMRVLCTRKDIPLVICGETTHAKTDVCLVDHEQHNILLLVQEDKRHGEDWVAAQPQLVAEAIGAFAHNNELRQAVDAAVENRVCLAAFHLLYR